MWASNLPPARGSNVHLTPVADNRRPGDAVVASSRRQRVKLAAPASSRTALHGQETDVLPTVGGGRPRPAPISTPTSSAAVAAGISLEPGRSRALPDVDGVPFPQPVSAWVKGPSRESSFHSMTPLSASVSLPSLCMGREDVERVNRLVSLRTPSGPRRLPPLSRTFNSYDVEAESVCEEESEASTVASESEELHEEDIVTPEDQAQSTASIQLPRPPKVPLLEFVPVGEYEQCGQAGSSHGPLGCLDFGADLHTCLRRREWCNAPSPGSAEVLSPVGPE